MAARQRMEDGGMNMTWLEESNRQRDRWRGLALTELAVLVWLLAMLLGSREKADGRQIEQLPSALPPAAAQAAERPAVPTELEREWAGFLGADAQVLAGGVKAFEPGAEQ